MRSRKTFVGTFMTLTSVLLVAVGTAGAQPATRTLYDDFGSGDLAWWKWDRGVGELEVSGGVLNISSSGKDLARTTINPSVTPNILEADVTLLATDSGGTSEAFVRLAGVFYSENPAPANPGDRTGDIFAEILIGERFEDGLQAWYQLSRITSADATADEVITSETLKLPTPLALNQPYTLKLEWDGANTFTFGVGATEEVVAGPAMQSAGTPFRRIAAGVSDDATKIGDASISATVDNVMANNVLHDDFSTGFLDSTLWNRAEQSYAVTSGGKARVTAVSGDGARAPARMGLHDQTAQYLETKVTLENSASNIEAGGQFRARIDGYFYNALFDDPAMHNGEEGDVYVQNLIREFDDGSRTASCGIDQCTNATCSTSTLLLFQNYTSMIEADTEYTLSIERTDDGRIICKLDDETQEYTILTNIYPAAVPFRRLYTRTQDANGNVSALFDDVYTDNEQPTADAGDNVTVDGGDEVTLTGMGSDNDSGIIAYMWRQTSGPDVTLTTAGAAASIARVMPDNTVVVRTDSSTSVTSFTAPDVDRDEELNFELTVIDSDGGSSTDTVTVNVDDGGGGGGCTLGGDGSRDSTLLLILALLSLVHLYRRRSGITRHD